MVRWLGCAASASTSAGFAGGGLREPWVGIRRGMVSTSWTSSAGLVRRLGCAASASTSSVFGVVWQGSSRGWSASRWDWPGPPRGDAPGAVSQMASTGSSSLARFVGYSRAPDCHGASIDGGTPRRVPSFCRTARRDAARGPREIAECTPGASQDRTHDAGTETDPAGDRAEKSRSWRATCAPN